MPTLITANTDHYNTSGPRMNAKGGVVDALLAKGKVVVVAEGSSASQGSVKLNRFPKNRKIDCKRVLTATATALQLSYVSRIRELGLLSLSY